MNQDNDPSSYSLRDAYNDGLAHGSTKNLAPVTTTEAQAEGGQGFGGDVVDATQYGLAQAVGGLAETGYQLTGFDALADARDSATDWGKSQLEEMSPEGREAMTAQIFQETAPDANGETSLELGDGATNWKTWALQISSLAGQMVPQIALGGGFASLGAKVAGKVAFKTAFKKAAAQGATKEASALAGKKAAEATFAAARGKAGVAGYAVVGTALAGGMIGNEVRDEVLEMTNDQLDQSNEYRKLYYQLNDMQPELDVDGLRDLAKRTLADRTATTVQKDPALIASNLLMEAVGGKFLDDIFRGVGSGSRTVNAGKQFAVQGSTEAVQGGIEQYASNVAIIEEGVDPSRDVFAGVKGAAANEGILGGALGGVMGVARKGEPLPQHEPLPTDNAEELNNADEVVQPESADQQQPEMTLDEAVEQIKAERNEYRGIDDDIAIAQKQGFDEEAVRLKAAKRNFEMAQDLMNEGDRESAMRFRERGLKIYRDVMEPNSPDNHESSNLFPAEYVATGDYLQKEQQPPVYPVQEGETIDAPVNAIENKMDASVIYGEHDTTEIDAARAKTEAALTQQQGETPINVTPDQSEVDQSLLEAAEMTTTKADNRDSLIVERQEESLVSSQESTASEVAVQSLNANEAVALSEKLAPGAELERTSALDSEQPSADLPAKVDFLPESEPEPSLVNDNKEVDLEEQKKLPESKPATTDDEVTAQASEAALSKDNGLPEPTEAQKEAGNYKKGHIKIQGLDIAIENPRESERKGTDPDGNEWAVKMAHHYGYIKKTEGADGDHVDVFIGKNPDSGKVFIVDQVNQDGSFDEHKVMLGFNNKAMAITGYKSSYQKGWKVGPVKAMSMAEFKDWLDNGDTKKPVDDKTEVEPESTSETTQKDSAESITDQEQKPEATDAKAEKPSENKEPVKDDQSKNEIENTEGGEQLTKKGVSLQDKEAESFEDFGEVLSGAKKHTYSFNEALSSDIDVSAEPLSKSFPLPDYEKMAADGVDKKILAFVAYLRANIPAKPRNKHKVKRWSEKASQLREVAREAMKGEKTISELQRLQGLSGNLVDRVDMGEVYALADEILPSQIRELGNFGLGKQHFQVYGGERNVNKWQVTTLNVKDGFRGLPKETHFNSKDEALAFIKSSITVSDGDNKPLVKFDVWSMRGEKGKVYVGKKVGAGKYIELANFETSKEAREHIVSHNNELVEQLKQKKKVGNHRRVEQNERIGKDYRRGENVTTDLFAETFGFRGVQFGNWVENSRRQQDVNNAYDGLLDLAGVLGVPAKALSLNGELGLAFGSQGSGGKNAAAAHYNTGTVVINLTKKNGAGSLSHEWFHALDGYFARAALDGDTGNITSSKVVRPKRKRAVIDGVQSYIDADPKDYGVRPEVYDAFKQLTKSIKNDTQIVQRSIHLDNRKSKSYWTTDHELTARAFERYVIDKLKKDGYESDYLSSILPKDTWDAMEQAMGNDAESYPYPTDGEAEILNKHYQTIFDALKTKETDKGTALFKITDDGGVASKIKDMRETLQRTEDTDKKEPATESAFSSVEDVKAWVAETEEFLGKKVNVVASKMDLPIAVKFRVGVANFGRDFDAIYDQETGETWINANQIVDKEHAIKTVLHETLGHGGVIDFLHEQELKGGKEVTDALEDIYRKAGRKLINRDIERYGFDYSDKKQRQTAVLEYIAHLAETGKKANWMHKVIGAVKNAMRKIFPNISWTDLDTLVLLEKGRRHLRENGNDGKGSDGSDGALMRLSDAIENDSSLNAEQKDFLDGIGPKTLSQTAAERLSQVMDRWRLKVRQGVMDRFAVLLEMDKKLLNGNPTDEENITSSSWVRARMSNGASGAVSAMMGAGRIYLDTAEGVIDVKENTHGLVHSLNKLGAAAEVERFFGWIAANRSQRLAGEGKENLFSDEQIEAGLTLNEGALQDGRNRSELYNQVFDEFQEYRNDVLTIAENAGIITEENRSLWADEFYVPFYRIMDDDDSVQGAKTMGGLSRQEAYKKLKGGSQNLNDLLQNTIMNFHHLLDASMKNLAAKQAMDNALELEVATETTEHTKGKQSTFVLRDGQKVWYDVHDDMVFQSLTALNSTGMNGSAMKAMRWFKRVFTNMTTSTPQFLVANLLRDSLSSMAVADLKYNPVGNVVSGIKSFGVLDKSKYERARLLATGGAFSFGHVYGEDADSIRYYIDGEMRRANVVKDPKSLLKLGLKPVQAAWDKWQDVSNSLENANRMAAFQQAESAGKGKLYAAHQSRDMMDFSGIGAWPAIRFLVDVVPFMNARLQGLDKLYRAGVKPTTKVVMNALGVGDVNVSLSEKKAAARFMAVVGALSMATMALYLRNKDDEEYQKLEDWHKDSYWWFRIPNTKHVLTAPKPFEVGAIATLVERLLEQAVDDKATGKLFAQRLGHMLTSTFAFTVIPQALQPALDVYANKGNFTGRQIETMGQQRLSPSQRTNDRTSAAAELLGNGMEGLLGSDSSYTLSPVQIDHLIGGYFGQVGAWAVGHADIVRNTLSDNERPAKQWYEYQPVRRFYKNLGDPHHDKQQTLFYEALRDSSRTYADLQQLRVDKDMGAVKELKSDHKELLSIRRRLSRASRKLTAINARIKRIKADISLSAAEKRRETDLLNVRKNALIESTKKLTDLLPR